MDQNNIAELESQFMAKINAEEKIEQNPIHKQEQSDPQLTELRGFVDPKEDLEPTLQDGKKSPEKADETPRIEKH